MGVAMIVTLGEQQPWSFYFSSNFDLLKKTAENVSNGSYESNRILIGRYFGTPDLS
jgi:hypothetical protein